MKQIRREATELIQKERVSAHCLSQFIGKLILPPRLFW